MIETVDRVKAALPSLEASVPPLIHTQRRDGSHHHNSRSVHDVEITLPDLDRPGHPGSVRVPARGWATIIPSVAVPLSLLGTFGVMYLLGYTLDNLSLMALTISTGFVVDDAIVVIENITRYLEQGMTPFTRPCRARGDRLYRALDEHFAHRRLHPHPADGRHRRPAVPRICSHAFRSHRVSLVVSLTTTPMMCAKFLPARHERTHGRVLPFRRACLQRIA